MTDFNRSLNLPRIAVGRPVTIAMVFLSALVVGIVAWRNIPIQLVPSGSDPPFLWVWLSYPNSSPSENLRQIAEPVEESFWTIDGVKRIFSRSRQNGCSVFLEFNQKIDMDVAYLALRDRLERVKPELPEDMRYIYIRRYSESDEPILYFGISITGRYQDPYRLVLEEVVKQLELEDGVANVEMWGGNEKIVQIELSLDRMRAYQIDARSLIAKLRNANFVIAGGILQHPDQLLMVRADGRIRSIDELKSLTIKGTHIKLEDVAEISYSSPPASWVQRMDGQDAIQIGVLKESEANTVELCERLVKKLESFEANPKLGGMQFSVMFDQGGLITKSLNNLLTAGIWGGFFALCVLLFFLRRIRMTFFITIAIPVSLMATITCMYFMNWSLNLITLSGLMICVGLVVDNAIVVVENIQTMKQKGLSSTDAAIHGAGEVGMAITLATLTTAVVFLPLILMSGDRLLTFYMMRLGLPVIMALLASLLTALLFIPLAVNRFAVPGFVENIEILEKGTRSVEGLVRWILKNRMEALFIMIILLGSSAIPLSRIVSTDQEEGHINDFQLRFNFPSHYSIAEIDSTLNVFEDSLNANKERYKLKTVVTGFRRGYGRMRVFLQEPPDRFWLTHGIRTLIEKTGFVKRKVLTRKEIIEEVEERFVLPPGIEMHTGWRRGAGEEAASYVTVYGNDTEKLLEIAEDMKWRLEMLPQALSVETDLESSADEIRIILNRDQAARYNVDAAAASFGLHSLIRGIDLAKTQLDGHDIETRVLFREGERESLRQIMNLPVSATREKTIRLDDVADVGYDRGLGEISRDNRRTRIRLKVITTEDDMQELSRSIDASLVGLSLPPGYEWGKGRRFSDIKEAEKDRNQAWILAVTFVFLLMGALFESLIFPWAVIATIPMAFLGVWWTLFLTGTQFGIMAALGVIILIGVVVNNAIVLVDRVNRLRIQGLSREEALVMAAKQRFRPITMTAMTTVMGLAPMAIGDSSMIGIPYAPMGRAIIGGMLTATVTTPVVVPLIYSLLEDFHSWIKAIFKVHPTKAYFAS